MEGGGIVLELKGEMGQRRKGNESSHAENDLSSVECVLIRIYALAQEICS